jgi:hypothetical protein
MFGILSECRVNVAGKLALAKIGEFFKLENGEATELKATPSVMKTSQLAEEDILAAARSTAGS